MVGLCRNSRIFRTGKKFSDLRRKEQVPYRILQVGLNRPRPEIDRRIGERVDQMVKAGFVEEVQQLLNEGYARELPSMSALGYRQMAAYLAGECSLDEAIEEMKKVTRKFYRRQMTWFKLSDENIHWFDLSSQSEGEVVRLVKEFLTR
ncbi:MAG: tRNA dimethylallyltransferase [Anaerolineales bacterium]